jgi:hypothetical protein
MAIIRFSSINFCFKVMLYKAILFIGLLDVKLNEVFDKQIFFALPNDIINVLPIEHYFIND